MPASFRPKPWNFRRQAFVLRKQGYTCLATNVFQGFGRKLAGIDLFHARIISKPI